MARETKKVTKSDSTKKSRPPNVKHLYTANYLQKNREKYAYRALFDSKIAKILQECEASRFQKQGKTTKKIKNPSDLKPPDNSVEQGSFSPLKSDDLIGSELSVSESHCSQDRSNNSNTATNRDPISQLPVQTDAGCSTTPVSESAPLLLLSFGRDIIVVPVSLPEISRGELGNLSSHSKTVVKISLKDFFNLSQKLCSKCRSALKGSGGWLFRKCPCQDLSKQTRVAVARLSAQKEDMKEGLQPPGLDECMLKKKKLGSVDTDVNGNIKHLIVNRLVEGTEWQVKAERLEDKCATVKPHCRSWNMPCGMEGEATYTRRLSPLRIPKNKIIFPSTKDDGGDEDNDKTPEYPLERTFFDVEQTQIADNSLDMDVDVKDRNVFTHLYSKLSTPMCTNYDEKISLEKRREKSIHGSCRKLQSSQEDCKQNSLAGSPSQIKSNLNTPKEREQKLPHARCDLQLKIDTVALQRKCKVQTKNSESNCEETGNGYKELECQNRKTETNSMEIGIDINNSKSCCNEGDVDVRVDSSHNSSIDASEKQNDQIPHLSPVAKSHSQALIPSPLCSSQPPTLYPVSEEKSPTNSQTDQSSNQENHIPQRAKRELPLGLVPAQDKVTLITVNHTLDDNIEVEETLEGDKSFQKNVNVTAFSNGRNHPSYDFSASEQSAQSNSNCGDEVVIRNTVDFSALDMSSVSNDVNGKAKVEEKHELATCDNHINVDHRNGSMHESNISTYKSSDQYLFMSSPSPHMSASETRPGTQCPLSALNNGVSLTQSPIKPVSEIKRRTQTSAETKETQLSQKGLSKDKDDKLTSYCHVSDFANGMSSASKQAKSVGEICSSDPTHTSKKQASEGLGRNSDVSTSFIARENPQTDGEIGKEHMSLNDIQNAIDVIIESVAKSITTAAGTNYEVRASVSPIPKDQKGTLCQQTLDQSTSRNILKQPPGSVHDKLPQARQNRLANEHTGPVENAGMLGIKSLNLERDMTTTPRQNAKLSRKPTNYQAEAPKAFTPDQPQEESSYPTLGGLPQPDVDGSDTQKKIRISSRPRQPKKIPKNLQGHQEQQHNNKEQLHYQEQPEYLKGKQPPKRRRRQPKERKQQLHQAHQKQLAPQQLQQEPQHRVQQQEQPQEHGGQQLQQSKQPLQQQLPQVEQKLQQYHQHQNPLYPRALHQQLPQIQMSQPQHLRLLQQSKMWQYQRLRLQHHHQPQQEQRPQEHQLPQGENPNSPSSAFSPLLLSTRSASHFTPIPVDPGIETQTSTVDSTLLGQTQATFSTNRLQYSMEPHTSPQEAHALSPRRRKRTHASTMNPIDNMTVMDDLLPYPRSNLVHHPELDAHLQNAMAQRHSPNEHGQIRKMPRFVTDIQSPEFHNIRPNSIQERRVPPSLVNSTSIAQFQLSSGMEGASILQNIRTPLTNSMHQGRLRNGQPSPQFRDAGNVTDSLVPRPGRLLVPEAMAPPQLLQHSSPPPLVSASCLHTANVLQQQLNLESLEDRNLRMHWQAVQRARQKGADKATCPLSPVIDKYPSWVKVPVEPNENGKPESQTTEKPNDRPLSQSSSGSSCQINQHSSTKPNISRSPLDRVLQQPEGVSLSKSGLHGVGISEGRHTNGVPTQTLDSPPAEREKTGCTDISIGVKQTNGHDIPNEPLDLSRRSRSSTPAMNSNQDKPNALTSSRSNESQSPAHRPRQLVQPSASTVHTPRSQAPTVFSEEGSNSGLLQSAQVLSEFNDCRPRSSQSLPSLKTSSLSTPPSPTSTRLTPLRSQSHSSATDLANIRNSGTSQQSPSVHRVGSTRQEEDTMPTTNYSGSKVTKTLDVTNTYSSLSSTGIKTSIVESVLLSSTDSQDLNILSAGRHHPTRLIHSQSTPLSQRLSEGMGMRVATILGQSPRKDLIKGKEIFTHTQHRGYPPTPEHGTSTTLVRAVPRPMAVSPSLTSPESLVSLTTAFHTSAAVPVSSPSVTHTTPLSSPPPRTCSAYSEKSVTSQDSASTEQTAKRKVVSLPVKDFFTNTVNQKTYSSLLMAKIASEKRRPQNDLTSDEILSFVEPETAYSDASTTFEINNSLQRNSVIDLTGGDDDCDVVSVSSKESHSEDRNERLGSIEDNELEDPDQSTTLCSDLNDATDPRNPHPIDNIQCDFINIEDQIKDSRQDLDYGGFDKVSVSKVSVDASQIPPIRNFNEPACGQKQSTGHQSFPVRCESVTDYQLSDNQGPKCVLSDLSNRDSHNTLEQNEALHSQHNKHITAIGTQEITLATSCATSDLRIIHTGKQIMAQKLKNAVAQRVPAQTTERDVSDNTSNHPDAAEQCGSESDTQQNLQPQNTTTVQCGNPVEEHENSTQRAAAALLELSSNPLYSNFDVWPETSDSYQEKVYQVHPILEESEENANSSNTSSKSITKTGRRVGRPLKDQFDEHTKATGYPPATVGLSVPLHCPATVLASSSQSPIHEPARLETITLPDHLGASSHNANTTMGLQGGQNLVFVLDPPQQPRMMFVPVQRLPFLPRALSNGGRFDLSTTHRSNVSPSTYPAQHISGKLEPKVSKLMNFRPQHLHKGEFPHELVRPTAPHGHLQALASGANGREKTQHLPVVGMGPGAIAHINDNALPQGASVSKNTTPVMAAGGPLTSVTQMCIFQNQLSNPLMNPPTITVNSSGTWHANQSKNNLSYIRIEGNTMPSSKIQDSMISFSTANPELYAPATYAVSPTSVLSSMVSPVLAETNVSDPPRTCDTYFTTSNEMQNAPESYFPIQQAQPEKDEPCSNLKRKSSSDGAMNDGKRQMLNNTAVMHEGEEERQTSPVSEFKARTVSNKSEYSISSQKMKSRRKQLAHRNRLSVDERGYSTEIDIQARMNISDGRSSSCSDINSGEVMGEMMEVLPQNVVATTSTEDGLVVLSLQTESNELVNNDSGIGQSDVAISKQIREVTGISKRIRPSNIVDVATAHGDIYSEHPAFSEQKKEEEVTSMLAFMMQNRNTRAEPSPVKN